MELGSGKPANGKCGPAQAPGVVTRSRDQSSQSAKVNGLSPMACRSILAFLLYQTSGTSKYPWWKNRSKKRTAVKPLGTVQSAASGGEIARSAAKSSTQVKSKVSGSSLTKNGNAIDQQAYATTSALPATGSATGTDKPAKTQALTTRNDEGKFPTDKSKVNFDLICNFFSFISILYLNFG